MAIDLDGWKPASNRLFVEALTEERSSGGILLPDQKSSTGVVLAVGPGKLSDEGERLPMSLKAGDHVIYSTYSGTKHTINGRDILIMVETDVLAVSSTASVSA